MALKPEDVKTLSSNQQEILESIESRLDLRLQDEPRRNSDGYINESIDVFEMKIDKAIIEELEKRYSDAGWQYVYVEENRSTQSLEITLKKN